MATNPVIIEKQKYEYVGPSYKTGLYHNQTLHDPIRWDSAKIELMIAQDGLYKSWFKSL